MTPVNETIILDDTVSEEIVNQNHSNACAPPGAHFTVSLTPLIKCVQCQPCTVTYFFIKEIFILTLVIATILLNYLYSHLRFADKITETFSCGLTLRRAASSQSVDSRTELLFLEFYQEIHSTTKGVVRPAHPFHFFAGSEYSHLSAKTFCKYPLPHFKRWYLAKKSLTFCQDNPSSLNFRTTGSRSPCSLSSFGEGFLPFQRQSVEP